MGKMTGINTKLNNDTITLRIKMKYFDQILSGDKKFEYRKCKRYYRKLLTRDNIKFLKLHYQQPRQLIVKVISIRKIKTPKKLSSSFGKNVYAIKLGKAKLLQKK